MRALKAGAFLALAACGTAAPSQDGPIGASSAAIINGQASPSSQNFVVEVVHPVGDGDDICSGTLVAPNLVLTARHCIAPTPAEGFFCDSTGAGTDGGTLGADYDPATVFIYAGIVTPGGFTAPNAHATRFFHDDATNVCNHDLALIELSDPIDGFPIATLDLDSTLTKGQSITAVGWGVTSSGLPPSVRQERTGIAIIDVGPSADANGFDVAPNEFDVGESICEGDSGGPGLDAANAVIGVVSRGGNDVTTPSSNAASTCVGASTVNVYTETAPFRDVILSAFAAVGSTPTLVAVPMGEACSASSECTSKLCATVDSDAGMTCTESCASTPCPGGFQCETISGKSLCAPAPSSSGCSVAASRETSGSGWLVSLFATGFVVVVNHRRKRRP